LSKGVRKIPIFVSGGRKNPDCVRRGYRNFLPSTFLNGIALNCYIPTVFFCQRICWIFLYIFFIIIITKWTCIEYSIFNFGPILKDIFSMWFAFSIFCALSIQILEEICYGLLWAKTPEDNNGPKFNNLNVICTISNLISNFKIVKLNSSLYFCLMGITLMKENKLNFKSMEYAFERVVFVVCVC